MLEQFVKIATDEQLLKIMANTCMIDMYKYSVASREYDLRVISSDGVMKKS
jgi:hypothetical protein